MAQHRHLAPRPSRPQRTRTGCVDGPLFRTYPGFKSKMGLSRAADSLLIDTFVVKDPRNRLLPNVRTEFDWPKV